MNQTSHIDRLFYKSVYTGDYYSHSSGYEEVPQADAHYISSRVRGGGHAPVLDIDFGLEVNRLPDGSSQLIFHKNLTARKYHRLVKCLAKTGLIDRVTAEINQPEQHHRTTRVDIDALAWSKPSKTLEHHHLFIDQVMPWRGYKRLLWGLMRAGIIGFNFCSVSRETGMSLASIDPSQRF